MKTGAAFMIHSTIKPTTILDIGRRAKEQGVELLHAPVSRTKIKGTEPLAVCMTGGNEATAERLRLVLDAYSNELLYVGPFGAAMALKICNNLAFWCGIMITLETSTLHKRLACRWTSRGGSVCLNSAARFISGVTAG